MTAIKKLMVAELVFYFIFFTVPCRAGFFSDLGAFFLDRTGRWKSSDDHKLSEISIAVGLNNPYSAEEIIVNLNTGNEILRTQVKSLKSIVNIQKSQILKARKEKDALRQLMAFRLANAVQQQEVDRETIKSELRDVFEEEKIVMIASFEEEKVLLKEDHVLELRDIKLELSQQFERKEAELEAKRAAEIEAVLITNTKQFDEIKRYEKSELEISKVLMFLQSLNCFLILLFSMSLYLLSFFRIILSLACIFQKDIAELKQALRAKDIALKELASSSATPKSASIPMSVGKKATDNDPVPRRAKPAKSSSTSSKSSSNSSNRPPVGINSPNPSSASRGGL